MGNDTDVSDGSNTGAETDNNNDANTADQKTTDETADNDKNDDKDADTGTGSSSENGNDGIYVVEKGDTLAIISRKMYGDVSHVDAICRMNGIKNGNLIYEGQKLLLP